MICYCMLLIDGIIYSDGYDFYRHVARLAEQAAHRPDYDMRIRLKAEQRRLVQESGSFHTTQKSKKSDFLKKSDFSMVWILPLSCTR